MQTIKFTKPKYDQLKAAYEKAVEENKDTFVLFGGDWLTNYAKYVLEYLRPTFDNLN